MTEKDKVSRKNDRSQQQQLLLYCRCAWCTFEMVGEGPIGAREFGMLHINNLLLLL